MTAFLVCAGLTFFVGPRINSYKIFDWIEKFRRHILVTSVVSKTPQMPKVGIFLP